MRYHGTGVTFKQDITDQQSFRANLVEKWIVSIFLTASIKEVTLRLSS